MTSAKDIALAARAQALRDEKSRAFKEAAARAAEEARKAEQHRLTAEAAIEKLSEWFPDVEWTWFMGGDYDYDTLLHDAAEEWPWSFMLKATRRLIDLNEPEAGYHVEIAVGDYARDTFMSGYSYFSGSPVKSAADVGRYLEQKA